MDFSLGPPPLFYRIKNQVKHNTIFAIFLAIFFINVSIDFYISESEGCVNSPILPGQFDPFPISIVCWTCGHLSYNLCFDKWVCSKKGFTAYHPLM